MDALEKLQKWLKGLSISIDEGRAQTLIIFLQELLVWNKKINLTAIKTLDEGIEKHLIDSLTVVRFLKGDERLLDIGSGGGLPVIPLKIYFPELEAFSVDSVEKKILFQRHAIRKLRLHGVTAIHSRAEMLAEEKSLRETFDIVISRAFSSLDMFVEMAYPFLKKGGRLIAMKGPDGVSEIKKNQESLGKMGWTNCTMDEICLPQSRAKRTLIILTKN